MPDDTQKVQLHVYENMDCYHGTLFFCGFKRVFVFFLLERRNSHNFNSRFWAFFAIFQKFENFARKQALGLMIVNFFCLVVPREVFWERRYRKGRKYFEVCRSVVPELRID